MVDIVGSERARKARTGPPRPGSARVEAPLTLTTTPPRPLRFGDQLAMWGNLGISLFGPITGALIAATTGSIATALAAIVVGCVLGAAMLGGCAWIGATTGAPAMVSLRGLFGRRGSIVPTVLNIGQNIGWATMEIIVISTAAAVVVGEQWRWVFVVLAGVLATAMAVRPLGSVRLLRKVMVWLVLAASVFLFVQVLLRPRGDLPTDAVLGFWPAVDLALAGIVSFCPLAADYSRHSRSRPAALGGAMIGFGLASASYLTLGVLALAHLGGDDVLTALVALPAGGIALAILMVDEVDEAFANIYSTTLSSQNLFPRWDRRFVSVGIGVIATTIALLIDFSRYQTFLFAIGAIFVPLFAVALADFFVVSRQRWDVSATARFRVVPVIAWAAGFCVYQLISPAQIPGWSSIWAGVTKTLGLQPPAWLGASFAAIVTAAVIMIVLGRLVERRDRDRVSAPR